MADPIVPKILAFAGSLRRGSWNKMLVRAAATAAAGAGADVHIADLRDFPLPIFDEDLERENGTPTEAMALKKLFVAADGLLIASPEYNSSISAALKNAIDWVSRPAPGEAPLVAFTGKTAAILATSPGGLGGLRGLVHLRSILGSIGVLVLPEQTAIPKAHEAFASDGSIKDAKTAAGVAAIGRRLAELTASLKR